MTNNYFLGSLGRALLTGILLLGGSLLASAQAATGSIHGTVADPSGAVVSGAKVAVINKSMGTRVVLSTNDSGLYEAPLLIPGVIDDTVTASSRRSSKTSKNNARPNKYGYCHD